MSVEKRNIIQTSDIINFNLTGLQQRVYRFEFSASNLDHPGLSGVLEDNYLNTRTPVNLSGLTNVNFTVDANPASAAADRFRIVFSSAADINRISMNAVQQNTTVSVDWKVINQSNISRYEVERSANGLNYSKLETRDANNIFATEAIYNWVDQTPVIGDNYYRIREVALNGAIVYSNSVMINYSKGAPGITVFPNPVTDGNITVQFNSLPEGIYTISLLNSMGQSLLNNRFNHAGGSALKTLLLGKSLNKGSYILKVTGPDGKRSTEKIIVE